VRPTSRTSTGESFTIRETAIAAAKESGTASSVNGTGRRSVRTTSKARMPSRRTTARPAHQDEVARAQESSTRSTRSPPRPSGPSASADVTWLEPPVAASSPISPRANASEPPTARASARRPPPASRTARTASPAARTIAPPPSAPKRLPATVTKASSAVPVEEGGAGERGHEQHRLEEVREAVVAGVLARAEWGERHRRPVDPEGEQIDGEHADEKGAQRELRSKRRRQDRSRDRDCDRENGEDGPEAGDAGDPQRQVGEERRGQAGHCGPRREQRQREDQHADEDRGGEPYLVVLVDPLVEAPELPYGVRGRL
jgi:hypothetical protein